MDARVNNFLNKYFTRTFYLPEMGSDKALQVVQETVEREIHKLKLSSSESERILTEMRQNLGIIAYLVAAYEPTVRLLNFFKRGFPRTLQRVSGDVYLADVVVLALIEACDGILFDFIRGNRRLISFSLPERMVTLENFDETQIDQWRERLGRLLESQPQSPVAARAIGFLYPHLELYSRLPAWKGGESTGNIIEQYSYFKKRVGDLLASGLQQQRVFHRYFVDRYFQSLSPDEAVSIVTNNRYRDRIIHLCSQESPNLKGIAKRMRKLFPAGDRNAKLRDLTTDWILREVDEQAPVTRTNLLLAASIAARYLPAGPEYELATEKRKLAYAIHYYLSRDMKMKGTLNRILQLDDASDEFAAWCVSYALDTGEMSFERRFTQSEKVDLLRDYLARMQKKVQDSPDFFTDEKVWDSPLWTFLRWCQAYEKLGVSEREKWLDPGGLLADLLAKNINAFRWFVPIYFRAASSAIRRTPMEQALVNSISVGQILQIYDQLPDSTKAEAMEPSIVAIITDMRKLKG